MLSAILESSNDRRLVLVFLFHRFALLRVAAAAVMAVMAGAWPYLPLALDAAKPELR